MARPRTITDQQIVEAAREVFLKQGFSATTAEIARRAGISEGTLFKRFAHKEDLFASVIGFHDYAPWYAQAEAFSGVGEVRGNLERMAWLYLDAMRQVMPQLVMIWSRGHSLPELHRWAKDPWQRDVEALSRYLRAEEQLGRLRCAAPEVVAEALLGALSSHLHRQFLYAAQDGVAGVPSKTFVSALLDTWWCGLAPAP